MRSTLTILFAITFLAGPGLLAAPSSSDSSGAIKKSPASRPTTGPASKASTGPSTGPATAKHPPLTPEQQKRLDVLRLTRRSLELFKQKKYDEVEKVLMEALALDPDNATNVYNMACIKSLKGKTDDAMTYLERAADAGFTDFIHIEQDADLQSLRALPRYKALIAAKDHYQKKYATKSMEGLKKQFGEKYLYEVDTDSKLLFVADTDPQTLADVKKWLAAQAKSQWELLFSHKPDQYIAILLPSLADFKKIIRQPGVEGIYMHDNRVLIARRLGQVMTHEFTHAMHAGDVESVGQEHPIWIVEGLASLFEAGQFEGDKLVPKDNFRLAFLQYAARTKRLIPLDKLITQKQAQFVANANIAYGQASSLMLYLYEKDLLRNFYDTYKGTYDKDATGKFALEKVTGKTLAQVDKDWRDWMVKRTPPATSTGPQGAFMGIRFSQENDGLKIDEVVRGGPAEKAGVKTGDVLVGLNDMDVRDHQSLMPMLVEYKPGETITLKVRRGTEYHALPVTLGRRDGKSTSAPAPAPAASQPATAPKTSAGPRKGK